MPMPNVTAPKIADPQDRVPQQVQTVPPQHDAQTRVDVVVQRRDDTDSLQDHGHVFRRGPCSGEEDHRHEDQGGKHADLRQVVGDAGENQPQAGGGEDVQG